MQTLENHIDKVQYINTMRSRVIAGETVSNDELRTGIQYVKELQEYYDARKSWIEKFIDRVKAEFSTLQGD